MQNNNFAGGEMHIPHINKGNFLKDHTISFSFSEHTSLSNYITS